MKNKETESRQIRLKTVLLIGILGFLMTACGTTTITQVEAMDPQSFKMSGSNTAPLTIICNTQPTFELSLGGGSIPNVTARDLNAGFDNPQGTVYVSPRDEQEFNSGEYWVNIKNLSESGVYGVEAIIELAPGCLAPAPTE